MGRHDVAYYCISPPEAHVGKDFRVFDMSNNRSTKRPKPEIVDRVLDAFFVFSGDPLLDQLQRHQNQTLPWDRCTTAAFEGLQSIIHAAGLPFELTQHSVLQRQFDSLHTAERIEGLKEASPGAGLSPSQAASARSRAENRMSEFLYSSEGSDWLRDSVVFQLNSHLDTPKLRMASQELLVQAVIGSWTVFESFARAFIITWVNLDPTRASIIVNAKDLRDVFGKQVVSIEGGGCGTKQNSQDLTPRPAHQTPSPASTHGMDLVAAAAPLCAQQQQRRRRR